MADIFWIVTRKNISKNFVTHIRAFVKTNGIFFQKEKPLVICHSAEIYRTKKKLRI